MQQTILAAHVRKETGKGAARQLRKNKQIPAIFYGPSTESTMLTINLSEFDRILKSGGTENIIIDLQVTTDAGTDTRKAILKDYAVDPVKGSLLHADFYEISMDKKISVNIPVHLINTPKGVTDGGILQHIRRQLSVTCLPDKIIASLELDVSGMEMGDSLHIRDIHLPEGVDCDEEDHLTVVIVAAPAAVKEAEEGEEGEEGEEEAVSDEGESSEEVKD